MDIKERLEKLKGYTTPDIEFDYLNDLAEAIIRVEESYCYWGEYNKTQNQRIERVFAYEMYHQLRMITKNNNRYDSSRIDGEIQKKFKEIIEKCGTGYELKQSKFTPDLTIHNSQRNRFYENQKLIVEIKSRDTTGDPLKETILKLNHYLRVLNFQSAVFISVNTELKKLIENLQGSFIDLLSLECKKRFDRIIVMNYKDRHLEILPLSYILTLVTTTYEGYTHHD